MGSWSARFLLVKNYLIFSADFLQDAPTSRLAMISFAFRTIALETHFKSCSQNAQKIEAHLKSGHDKQLQKSSQHAAADVLVLMAIELVLKMKKNE